MGTGRGQMTKEQKGRRKSKEIKNKKKEPNLKKRKRLAF